MHIKLVHFVGPFCFSTSNHWFLYNLALYFQKFVGDDLADVVAKACHAT
jgi:hypothetical protein